MGNAYILVDEYLENSVVLLLSLLLQVVVTIKNAMPSEKWFPNRMVC